MSMEMKKKPKKASRWLLSLFALFAYAAGVVLVVIPFIRVEIQDYKTHKAASEFLTSHEAVREAWSDFLDEVEEEAAPIRKENAASPTQAVNMPIAELVKASELSTVPYSALLRDMEEYNQSIYENKQDKFVDPWSYEQPGFNLKKYGINDEIVGTVNIPKIGSFPLYLGANASHMALGVAQMTETSMPIGGVNTNCVIAGHRGWNNGKYLREIEKVVVGDVITVTNLWYEMRYEVKEIKITMPNAIEQILIQPGRDLLTIVTCHPYASGGKYRWLVICERISDEQPVENGIPNIVLTDTEQQQETVYESNGVQETTTCSVQTKTKYTPVKQSEPEIQIFTSENEILLDDILHYIGFGMMILVPLLCLILCFRRKKKRE